MQTALMPPSKPAFLKTFCLLVFFPVLFISARHATGQIPQDKIKQILGQQVGMDDALPDEKNPDGLHFQFSKIDESSMAQGHFVRYRAYVAGASEKKKYALAIWKIDSDPQVIAGEVYVNAKGLLMVHKPRPDQESSSSVDSDDEIDLAIQAARGEPVRFVLATADHETLIPGTIVPYPIESNGGNCRIEVRLATHDGQAVLIYADGLPPNKEVSFQAVSAGESETAKFTANARGHAATIDLPFVQGKDSGLLKLSLAIQGCTASVEIPWGKGSYHPL